MHTSPFLSIVTVITTMFIPSQPAPGRLSSPPWHSLVALLFVCVLGPGCEPKKGPAPPDLGVTSSQDASPDLAVTTGASPDTTVTSSSVVISGSGLRLTVQDFEHAANRAMVFAPDEFLEHGETKVPRARLQRPFLQVSVTRQLVEEALVEREAAARAIEVTMEEVEAFIASHDKLRRFAVDEDVTAHLIKGVTLKSLDLALSDLHDIARKQLLREKLSVALLDEITREEVRSAWIFSEDLAHIMLARISNTPTSSELDDFINDHNNMKKVESHFASHKNRYIAPGIVQLDLWRAPSVGKLDTLKLAAAMLASGEQDLDAIAATHGLTLERGQRLVRKEDPRAFNAADGEIGISMDAPRGDYVWIVRAHEEAHTPELDRPLIREIASTLMREENAIPGATAQAVEVAGALKSLGVKGVSAKKLDEVQAILGATSGASPQRVRVLAPMSLQRDPSGFVRGVGTSAELLDAIFALDAEGAVLTPALPVDQYLWTGILLKRQRPDLKAFEANYPRYLAQYREAIAPTLLDMRFATWQQRDEIKADMDVLRKYYGAYEKKR